MVKIKVTEHAKDRMKKYGISEELLLKALEEPDCVAKGHSNRKIAQKALDDKHLLRVVFEDFGEVLIAVTCYKARSSRYAC